MESLKKFLIIGIAALSFAVTDSWAQTLTSFVSVTGGTLPTWTSFGNQVVSNFKLGTKEVSVSEWNAVKAFALTKGYDISSSEPSGTGDNYPIEDLNWYDAVKWCNAKTMYNNTNNSTSFTPVYTTTTNVSEITRNGTIATAVTYSPHTLVTGDFVTISNASQSGYNLTNAAVTYVSEYSFTYVVSNATATPATPVSGSVIAATIPYKRGDLIPTSNALNTGFRLPTEIEWEWAAIGGTSGSGTQKTYAGSNDGNAVAWTRNNSPTSSQAIGTKTANEILIYDLSGNVYEWCFDAAESLNSRRVRGGGWVSAVESSATLNRGYRRPDIREAGFGFRLAQKP